MRAHTFREVFTTSCKRRLFNPACISLYGFTSLFPYGITSILEAWQPRTFVMR